MDININQRRHISDTIHIHPWLKLMTYEGHTYLYKVLFNKSICSYHFMVTNGYALWQEIVDEESFKEKCKSFNPNIEATYSVLLEQVETGLSDGIEKQILHVVNTKDNNKLNISFKSKMMSSIPFSWTFSLEPSPINTLRDEVLDPTYVILSELIRRQQNLYVLLEEKDREIQDYKDQGTSVSRKRLETARFDRNAFENIGNLNKDFVGSCTSNNSIVNVFTKDLTKNIYRSIMMNKQCGNVVSTDEEAKETVADIKQPTFDTLSKLEDETSMNPNLPSWNELGRLPKSVVNDQQTNTMTDEPIKTGLTPEKDIEKQRREALRRRLEDETEKKSKKKKRKLNI